MERIKINSLAEMQQLAKKILVDLVVNKTDSGKDESTVLVLTGNLGAGKTTFMQFLATELGVQDVVQSPTFIIMRRYQTANETFQELVHMDAYRLDSLDELRPLGFENIIKEANTLICVEWGEKISEALPERAVLVTIEHGGESEERIVELKNL